MTFQFDPLFAHDQQQHARDMQEAWRANAALPPRILRFALLELEYAAGDTAEQRRIRAFRERVVAAEGVLGAWFGEKDMDAALARLAEYEAEVPHDAHG